MRRRRNLPIVALALAVIAVQLLTAAAGKPQYLTQLTMAGYYSLVIVGLTLLMGYTGQNLAWASPGSSPLAATPRAC